MVLAGLLYPGYSDGSFDLRPKYLLIDEIEHLKPEYQNALLQLMETGILTQTHALQSQTNTPKNVGICYK